VRRYLRPVSFFLGLFYFFYFALVGVYIIFLPKMLSLSGYNASRIGLIFSAAPVMRFALPFVFRRFGGLGPRLYTGALGMILVSSLLFLATLKNFWGFFSANLLYGAAMGIVLPYVDTIALERISREHYGRVRLWGSLGFMAIALWLGGILETPRQTVIYLGFLALLTFSSGLLVRRFDHPATVENSDVRHTDEPLSIIRHWAFWLSAFLLQVSFGGFYNFFTIYETAHGISLQTTTWLWSFGVICEIAMLYFQGPLLKKNLLGLIEMAVATAVVRWGVLWLWPSSLWAAYISQALHAFNFALYYTAAIAYVYDLYTQKKLAQQFFLGITFGLGGAIGAIVAGRVYDLAAGQLFLFQAMIALISWAMIRLHIYRRSLDAGR
jgi:PPP family 3-phenylpropionic acid transporter